jgi:hypothetical protein
LVDLQTDQAKEVLDDEEAAQSRGGSSHRPVDRRRRRRGLGLHRRRDRPALDWDDRYHDEYGVDGHDHDIESI